MAQVDGLIDCVVEVLDGREFAAGAAGVSDESVLAELDGWDSVNALRVLQEVERRYQRRMPLDAFARVVTFRDLRSLLEVS